MNKKTLCKIFVTVGFVYGDETRGTDEFVMDVVYQTNQHLFKLVKSEISRRNPSMKYATYMDYYLIKQEEVCLIKHPFKVEQE